MQSGYLEDTAIVQVKNNEESIVRMYHILFVQSSIEGHFGCSHVLATVNNAAIPDPGKDEILPFATTRRILENTMISEISPTEENQDP